MQFRLSPRLLFGLLLLWLVGVLPAHSSDANYWLTIVKNGSGTGAVSVVRADNGDPIAHCSSFVCSAYVTASTPVRLTATAGPASVFTGWTDACGGTGSTCTLTMDRARDVGVNLRVATPLTITKSGAGTGRITISGSMPAATDCTSFPCTREFGGYPQITLTAAAAAGSLFMGWSGACSGTAPTCTISMSQARNVGVHLRGVSVLTIVKNGSGNGSVSIVGVTPAVAACTSFPCARPFSDDTPITLTVSATVGTLFTGWSGACSGSATTCTLAMSQARDVGVYLRVAMPLTLVKNGSGTGSVAIGGATPATTHCTVFPCMRQFAGYPQITLSATAAPGTLFTGWSGACTGTAATCTLAMSQARNVGVYLRTGIPLTINRSGSGQGTVSIVGGVPSVAACHVFPCARDFVVGSLVTLTASPANGSTFTGWSGACSGNGNSCQVLMSQARGVTAQFGDGLGNVQLTVQLSGSGRGKVTSDPGGIDCGTTCTANFASYTLVTLTAASAGGGSIFTGWTGACSGTAAVCRIGMNAARSVQAEFTEVGGGIKAISVGDSHTCALTGSGAARCWGKNIYGQLGDGTDDSRETPAFVSGLYSDIQAISAGGRHTCALTTRGAVLCWGGNASGQLGNGTAINSTRPVEVVGLPSGVRAISAGAAHSCALTLSGEIWCWGANDDGRLGDGTTTGRMTPVSVSGLPANMLAISAGEDHSCAVSLAGITYCWGSNGMGQLGDGTSIDRPRPVQVRGLSGNAQSISAGYAHSCVLNGAGALFCWGNNRDGQLGDGTRTNRLSAVRVTGLSSGVREVSAAGSHTCALTGNTVRCWGSNLGGALGDGTTVDRLSSVEVSGLPNGVTAISAGGGWARGQSCVLVGSESVHCWGAGSGMPTEIAGLSSAIVKVTAGGRHSCALTSGGAVRCWGMNFIGQLGNGDNEASAKPVAVVGLSSGVREIGAGFMHTCALDRYGGVSCWGANFDGQLGNGNVDRPTPVGVAGLSSGVQAIGVGDYHTCALLFDGSVRCWGSNRGGQLGNGTATNQFRPVDVFGLPRDVRMISAGGEHSCALTNHGTVMCWGTNAQGAVGDGTTTGRLTPVAVIGLSGVKAISSGGNHSCALTNDGAIRCWGWNLHGQIGDGSMINRLTPVAINGMSGGVRSIDAGYGHGCALGNSGSVRCWGLNDYGQLGDGTRSNRLTPVDVVDLSMSGAEISAGGEHTCVIIGDGGVRCWGANDWGQLGDGTTMMRLSPVPVYGLSGW